MLALQKIQEQTALLHAQFLEGQEAAQRSFQSLIEQQQQLFGIQQSPDPALFSQSAPENFEPLRPALISETIIPKQSAQSAPLDEQNHGADIGQILLEIVSSQ